MQDIKNENYTDADRLAEEFLIVEHIWDPWDEPWQEGPDLYPALKKHLSRSSFEQGDFTLRFWRGDFYKWEAGRYFKVSDTEMKCTVKAFVHKCNQDARIYRDYAERHVSITTAKIQNILLCLGGTGGVYIPERCSLNSWLGELQDGGSQTLSFNNGLLIMDGKSGRSKLISHTPRYFSLTRLPYDYDAGADCPKWRRFLTEVMEGDDERIELLRQWAGYLLMPDNLRQKFLLIAGSGRNGKTVFTSVLERMVGLDNVSHVPLCQFSNQFALSGTLGKVLNSSSESSGVLDKFAETTLKSYTSGDRMTFQRKYKEPVHDFPTAKIMISTNQLPQFTDKSSGIWRRLLFVPFERSIAEHQQNPNLIEELSTELGGIFNWAFEGLKSLMQAGRFTMPKKCSMAIEQYRRDVNPARAFLLDNYAAGLDYGGLPAQEVYACYVRYCQDNGFRHMNSNNFGKEVKRTFPSVRRDRRRFNGRQTSIYSGMAVKEESEVADNYGNIKSEFQQNLY
jgi:P4 family phage/plasmid primase-like protien